jgi:prepilin-type N-terminal cleavage/methylation domain-containing protein
MGWPAVKIKTRISTTGTPINTVPSISRRTRARGLATPHEIEPGSLPTCRGYACAAEIPMRMNLLNNRGFTLIELIVVTALIAIMLAVAIPRLERGLFSDNGDKTARWIIATVRQLKEKAIADQQTYLLNVSPDTRQLWISTEGKSEVDATAAHENAYHLPKGMSIEEVAFSENEHYSSGVISIRFYAAGYSDKAVIRMRTSDGDRLSFFIEPFLPQVDFVRGNQG